MRVPQLKLAVGRESASRSVSKVVQSGLLVGQVSVADPERVAADALK